MAHLTQDKDALLKRIRRISGQAQALERALEGETDCAKTLHLAAAIRGAVHGLMDELIEAHAREHVARPGLTDSERSQGLEEVLEAIRRYAK